MSIFYGVFSSDYDFSNLILICLIYKYTICISNGAAASIALLIAETEAV